jgi:dihydrofolate reductase
MTPLLLGRATYEAFAAAWPTLTGEFSDKFDTMPKYVVASTINDPEVHDTQVVAGTLTDVVARLRDQTAGDIVHGSPTLFQGLLEHDLVEELRLMAGQASACSAKRRPRSGSRCRTCSRQAMV